MIGNALSRNNSLDLGVMAIKGAPHELNHHYQMHLV